MLGKAIDIVALVSLLAGGAFFGIAIVPDTPRQTVVLPEYMVNGVDIDRIPTGKVWAATPVEVDSTSLDDIKALVGGGCLSIGAVIVLLARTLARARRRSSRSACRCAHRFIHESTKSKQLIIAVFGPPSALESVAQGRPRDPRPAIAS